MKFRFLLVLFLCYSNAHAQKLPIEYWFSDDGCILYSGGATPVGLYDPVVIKTVELQFPQEDFWDQLTRNYYSETPIVATLKYDNKLIGDVGVRFRGNSSYKAIPFSQKKSFKIDVDFVDEDLKLLGYKNLRFNNAHEDPSFMREVLYGKLASRYTPIAKANFIHLYINGEDWGLYPNVQHIDKTFLEEWFLSNDGALFRAATDENSGSPGWGDGTAALNYLGNDTAEYQQYYTLKSSDIDSSWQKLVNACYILDRTSEFYFDKADSLLAIDKILWFLAVENIFTDDDSYVDKGKMDYMAYYEPESGQLTTMEYDGNTTFQPDMANSLLWGPFKNSTNANYPLLSRLLDVPKYRQRYLAHFRTILNETFIPEVIDSVINSINIQIKDLVANDPKKIYSTEMYTESVEELKDFISQRKNYLYSYREVQKKAPTINSATQFNFQMVAGAAPLDGETAIIQANVISDDAIKAVYLNYCNGITGRFTQVQMFDDGGHHDNKAKDGLYGAEIPGMKAGTLVRYYIEAVANTSAQTVSYLPAGAEHDVFVYQVETAIIETGLVINELMADNSETITDEEGKYEDWIELFNANNFEMNLGGYYLSDDPEELQKWHFPNGTIISANGYLIVWADDDEADGLLHTTFKLSADGEELILSDTEQNIIDQVSFGEQTADISFARYPNGAGDFRRQAPTYNKSNDDLVAVEIDKKEASQFLIYPVPARDKLYIRTKDDSEQAEIEILNSFGQRMIIVSSDTKMLDISTWPAGMYVAVYLDQYQKILKTD